MYLAAPLASVHPHLLGVQCPKADINMRELCDQYAFVATLINNKTDGFLDDLTPTIELTAEAIEGCGDGSGALAASDTLRLAHGRNLTAVLQGCSNEVMAASSRARREAVGPPRSVIISPYSSSATAANETEYANVARIIATTDNTAEAAAALCAHHGWSRVAILSDQSSWAQDSMRFFEQRLLARSPDAHFLLDSVQRNFSRSVCEQGDDKTLALARTGRLEEAEASIITVFSSPRCVGRLLAESYRSKQLFGAGYAWVISWVGDDLFLDPLTGMVDTDAVCGAQGLHTPYPTDPSLRLHRCAGRRASWASQTSTPIPPRRFTRRTGSAGSGRRASARAAATTRTGSTAVRRNSRSRAMRQCSPMLCSRTPMPSRRCRPRRWAPRYATPRLQP